MYNLCAICHEREAFQMATPCNHLYLCQTCLDNDPVNFQICSICQADVQKYIKCFDARVDNNTISKPKLRKKSKRAKKIQSIQSTDQISIQLDQKFQDLEDNLISELEDIITQNLENKIKSVQIPKITYSAEESRQIAMQKGGPYLKIEEARARGQFTTCWIPERIGTSDNLVKMLQKDRYQVYWQHCCRSSQKCLIISWG